MNNGEYKKVKKVIHHPEIKGQEEIYHYETIKEYENGGKDLIKIIDQEYIEHRDAYDEEIEEEVFIPYTEKELQIMELQRQIDDTKHLLKDTDYKTLKFVEGYYSIEEYEPIKTQRQEYRNQINELEEQLNSLKGE